MVGTFVSLSARKVSGSASIGDGGMVIRSCAFKSQNSIERTQPRIMFVTYNGNPCTTIAYIDSSTRPVMNRIT